MSDDQFQELREQIAKGFAKQDVLVAKLYEHFEERFNHLDETKASRDQVVKLQDTMDSIAARLETDDQERVAMNHQLERHEHWIGRAAKRLGVGYER